VAGIVNDNGKELARLSFEFSELCFANVSGRALWDSNTAASRKGQEILSQYAENVRAGSRLTGWHWMLTDRSTTKSFTTNVDNLTDNMAVRIISVNGKNPGSGLVVIPRESAVLRVIATTQR